MIRVPVAGRRVRIAGWNLYLAAGAAALLAYFLVPQVRDNGLLFNLIGLSSSVAILIGVRRNKPSTPRAWYLFAVGQLFFVCGDSVYYGYDTLFHKDVPFPSVADFFYLAVYPALVAGLLIIIRRRRPRGDRAGLIDALILTVGLGFAAWVFLMAPYAHDPSLSLVEKLVSIAYPLMDVCLFSVAVRLTVDGGLYRPSLVLLLGSVVSLLTADAILGVLTLGGGYQEGGVLDAGWACYYLLWGAAALHPSMGRLGEEAPAAPTSISRSRLALLAAASLVAPLIQMGKTIAGEPVEPVIVSVAAASLFCLVMLRMAGLLRESERAAERERTMRTAAKTLVTASTSDEVYDAALASLTELLHGERWVRIVVLDHSGSLSARAGEAPDEEWPVKAGDLISLDAGELRRNLSLDFPLAQMPLASALRFPEEATVGTALPLFASAELKGLVVVGACAPPSSETRTAMQTLAAQVVLALESVTLAEDLAMRKSEARFQSLVQHSSDLITVIDAHGKVVYQSPSVRRILGFEPDEVVGKDFTSFIHPHERDSVGPLLTEAMPSAHPQVESIECRLQHAGHGWVLFEVLRTNLLHDPSVEGIVLNGRDISERKDFERQLAHQAFHDALTGLANRALFADRVEHALARQTRSSGGLGVIFIDLDDFKMINDSLGHAAGDQVLSEVSRRLLAASRPMDTVARFGGDEFSVLVEGMSYPKEIAEIADRISTSLHEPMSIDGKKISIHVSMGIATTEQDHALVSTADELIRNADIAMYTAKGEGKGHYQLFEPAMHAQVVERLEMKASLERAIDRGEFELYFQPVVRLPHRRIYGVEALIRWHHPDRGITSPGDFIPLAEETGIIVPLGNWVLEQACRMGLAFQSADGQEGLIVSVNVSVRQLRHPDFVDSVRAILRSTGFPPQRLMLELTESVMMHDTELAIERLTALKELDVRLAIDDFGTGYSSLSYLSRFPVDVLKIDRSFVSRMDRQGSEATLAAAIVRLGESLDLDTVAEGIELPEQLEKLNELGCTHGQGFFVAKPMPTHEVMSFIGEYGLRRAQEA